MAIKPILSFSQLVVVLCLSFSAAAEMTFPVLIRDHKFRPIVVEKIIQSLQDHHQFDGQNFKIVLGDSESPIAFDAEEEIMLKASTVYYHLEKARDFFLKTFGTAFIQDMGQMTIRIEMTRTYNQLGHYAHINTPAVYNDALSIMESPGYPSKGIAPWNKEIWFRPPQRIPLSELGYVDDGTGAIVTQLETYRETTHLTTLQMMLLQMTQENFSFSTVTVDQAVEVFAVSIGLEMAIMGIQPLSKLFARRWYWLDSAMIPEIIYHEYTHQALSDYLKNTHSGPVNEGMADYFSGQISESPILAGKIKKYNTFNRKSAKKRSRTYSTQYESDDYANDDFVFGLLWGLTDVLGLETAQRLVYESRIKLTSGSSIKSQLLDSLLLNCETVCSTPQLDRLKLLAYFQDWGI